MLRKDKIWQKLLATEEKKDCGNKKKKQEVKKKKVCICNDEFHFAVTMIINIDTQAWLTVRKLPTN